MPILFPQNQNEVSEIEIRQPELQKLKLLCDSYNFSVKTLIDFELMYDECSLFRLHNKRTHSTKLKKHVQWYNQAQYYLSIQSHREDWLQNNNDVFLSRILKEWEYHGALANYSVSALVALQHHLDYMRRQLNNALFELKKSLLTGLLSFKEYSSMRTVFLEELKLNQLRQQLLIHAMLLRLQTASHTHDITSGDVLWHTFNTAIKQSKLPSNYVMPDNPRRDLDKESFLFFHQLIFKYGTNAQKSALHQCQWHQTTVHTLIPMRRLRNDCLSLPINIKRWLSKNVKREAFYQASVINNLFKQALEHVNKPIEFSNLSVHPFIKDLVDCENKMKDLEQYLKAEIKTGFLAFIYWPQNQSIKHFQKELRNTASEKIAQVYLKFLEQLHLQLENTKSFPQSDSECVIKLLALIELHINNSQLYDSFKKHEIDISKILEQLAQEQKIRASKHQIPENKHPSIESSHKTTTTQNLLATVKLKCRLFRMNTEDVSPIKSFSNRQNLMT